MLVGEPAAETLVNLENPTVAVEAEATHIPDRIEVSVEGAEAGTQIHANDLVLPPGSTLDADEDLLVVNVTMAPTAEELEAEGAGEVEEVPEVAPEAAEEAAEEAPAAACCDRGDVRRAGLTTPRRAGSPCPSSHGWSSGSATLDRRSLRPGTTSGGSSSSCLPSGLGVVQGPSTRPRRLVDTRLGGPPGTRAILARPGRT